MMARVVPAPKPDGSEETMRITVKFLKLKDALGRVRESWCVLDGSQICGTYDTQEAAERNAAALRQYRADATIYRMDRVLQTPA